MTAGELINLLRELPPATTVCIAEVDEAFGARVQSVEIIDVARVDRDQAADIEAVQLEGGDERAVVMRW